MLKYPCLVLDHDDTVVQSETTINYPYFCYILDQFRPGATITLAEYIHGCFHLGFAEMCRQKYAFTEQELKEEYLGWKDYIRTHIPPPYPYEIVDSHYEQDISREKLESGIMNALDENKEDINETLASSVMVVEEIDDGLLSILRIIFGSTATIMLTVTTIVLALLIYACRYRRFGGFIWLGVDFILVSLMVFGIRSALDFAAELMMAEAEISTSVSSLIVPILKILDKDLNTAVIIYTVIAIALIAVGIVLKKTVGKKKIAQ